MNAKEMLEALKKIKEEYDAYYILNKYGEEGTHKEAFEKLRNFLKKDDMSIKALTWISHCYDCYYKNEEEYNVKNITNPFYYLERQIEVMANEKK